MAPPEYDAEIYARARPRYPNDWFAKLAAVTTGHERAWDAGTGNGQAAIGLAEHYDRVIATDVSKDQLDHAFLHPKIQYVHTPLAATEDELVAKLGGEGSVDLVTAAMAAHYFDLPSFYNVVKRVLKKPGGAMAVWSYNNEASPLEDVLRRFFEPAKPYADPRVAYVFDQYRTLPFPFEDVGLGCEGNPLDLGIEIEVSLDEFVASLRTWSSVKAAKEQGVELVSDEVVEELRAAWGGGSSGEEKKKVTYKAFMLVGRPKLGN